VISLKIERKDTEKMGIKILFLDLIHEKSFPECSQRKESHRSIGIIQDDRVCSIHTISFLKR